MFESVWIHTVTETGGYEFFLMEERAGTEMKNIEKNFNKKISQRSAFCFYALERQGSVAK